LKNTVPEMVYLEKFNLASADAEDGFVLSYPYQLEMQCYSHENVYPFKLFVKKGLESLSFEPITILYGGNGSGKSTLLNVIAQKLSLDRSAPFNNTPYFEDYLRFCSYSISKSIPEKSKLIASDDVFDLLLDTRAINEGVERRRQELFEEYKEHYENPYQLRSLEDIEEFKERYEAKRKTKSVYVSRRLPKEIQTRSNGESAFAYFTGEIKEDALYLLDEPENSLSAELQIRLASFLEESARFYGCQFIISTHSPFLLSMKGAAVYDLDKAPVGRVRWTELENVRAYRDFFEAHRDEFE